MEYIIFLWILLLVTAALAEDDSGLIFNNDEIMVKPNEKVNLVCGITETYRHCICYKITSYTLFIKYVYVTKCYSVYCNKIT